MSIENWMVMYSEDEDIATTCDMCGGDIYVGEEYYHTYTDSVCEHCYDDYAEQFCKGAEPDENSVLVGDLKTKQEKILVTHCVCCGSPIYAGYEYYEIDEDDVCSRCKYDYMSDYIERAEREEW